MTVYDATTLIKQTIRVLSFYLNFIFLQAVEFLHCYLLQIVIVTVDSDCVRLDTIIWLRLDIL